VQRALISRAARLALHLELMDECVLAEGKTLTQHDYQHYCSWSNSLARMLVRLGLEVPPKRRDHQSSAWPTSSAASKGTVLPGG
jgi:hypothetical protein